MPNIDLSKVKKEYLIGIFIILIALIGFIFYKNIFSPLMAQIKETSAEIQQKKNNIRKAKKSPEELKNFENELEEIENKIEDYNRRLKAKPDVPQILKELNQIAESLKIKFVSVSPLEREEAIASGGEETLLQIPVRIKLQCGYHQLGIFINQVENSSRFMKIRDLKINADPGNIWAHQIELIITSYSLTSKND